jgi:hypothetical protein
MGAPIPAFVSEYRAGSTDTLQVTTGSAQALSTSIGYFYVSNVADTTLDGCSLLYAVSSGLTTSLPATTWTTKIGLSGGVYKFQLFHNNGASRTVTWGSALAAALGFASTTTVVAASTTVTADYPSPYWWTPDQVVSLTGPTLFDPAINYGVPSSAGAAQRSSDMTAAYVENGVQYDAEYVFNGVQYYYKIRPQSGYTNQDLETWWSNGPRKGRRILMWRDRANTLGTSHPSKGSASPYNYVQYNPQPDLRSNFPAVPMNGGIKLTFWDVTFKFWVTQSGETPLTE